MSNALEIEKLARKVTKLDVKCKFCNEIMEKHTPNSAWWHLIYLSEGKTYEDIYG